MLTSKNSRKIFALPSFRLMLAAGALAFGAGVAPASAETIMDALAAAYSNNATLNAARAGARATDESVPIAKAGMRPQISADSTLTITGNDRSADLTIGNFGIQIDQALYDGNQTRNNVAAAEAQVRASQFSLTNTTQNTLFDAATAYADVYRDRQIAALRSKAIAFLNEQVRSARARFEVGEGTRTDVAQAEAERAGAQAALTAAQASVKSSEAVYRQITGANPGKLKAPSPVKKLLPKGLDTAYATAESNHPAVKATEIIVDARGYSVKAKEGELLPQLSARARVEATTRDVHGNNGGTSDTEASVTAQLRIPLYTGGRVDAQVRQSKEQLSQARIHVLETRDQVRAAVASAWAQYESATASLAASAEQIDAAQIALNGLIEERNVGQRTTLDVLNGQNRLLDAQISQIDAQRNVVVASFAVLSSTGRLTPQNLGLAVATYDPDTNFNAVKDKWFGLRTVDGR